MNKNEKNQDYLNILRKINQENEISQKTQLTIRFMKKKMQEYDELKKELDK